MLTTKFYVWFLDRLPVFESFPNAEDSNKTRLSLRYCEGKFYSSLHVVFTKDEGVTHPLTS